MIGPHRWAWWACGVDASVLDDALCPHSERVRFGALGSLVILAVAVSLITAAFAAHFIFFNGNSSLAFTPAAVQVMICLVIGVLWASFVLNLLRLTVGLAGRSTDRVGFNFGDIVRALGILIVTAAISLPSATPLQVIVTERDASARALAISQVLQINAAHAADSRRVDELVENAVRASDLFPRLDSSATEMGFFQRVSLAIETNPGVSIALFFGIWLLFALPPVIRLLTDRGAYDFLIEHRNRRWLSTSGIETKAYTVFSADGSVARQDAFHSARASYRAREAQILASRRFDSELQRQVSIARFERMRTGQISNRDVPELLRARKKEVEVFVEFATRRVEIKTLEGAVVAEKGDAIVTAKTGETWPVPRKSFELRYAAAPSVVFGHAGTYYSKPTVVRAIRLISAAKVEVARGHSELDAAPGDWLIDYGDGTNGVLSSAIFENTYELLRDTSASL
jgi:hypothetical protein